jgi:hypothetical protein
MEHGHLACPFVTLAGETPAGPTGKMPGIYLPCSFS